MKNAKNLLEKFDSWKYDIYENHLNNLDRSRLYSSVRFKKLLEQQATNTLG